jgi:hypothetical protein
MATNQKVGNSTLSGRATFLNKTLEILVGTEKSGLVRWVRATLVQPLGTTAGLGR